MSREFLVGAVEVCTASKEPAYTSTSRKPFGSKKSRCTSMMSNAVCLGGNTKGYGFASMVSTVGNDLISIVLGKR